MANLTRIQLPNGVIYDIVDAGARDLIKLGIRYKIVSKLPDASADTMGIIYLLPVESKVAEDVCEEYFTVANDDTEPITYRWERIGSTKIDLSDYSKKSHNHTVTSNVTLTGASYTPNGNVSGTFTGNEVNIAVTGTPTGTISTPNITIKSDETGTVSDLYSMDTNGDYRKSAFNAGTTPITMEVSNEILIISNGIAPSYTPESVTLPRRKKIALTANNPTFTGDELTSRCVFTPTGQLSLEFNGIEATIAPEITNRVTTTSTAIE